MTDDIDKITAREEDILKRRVDLVSQATTGLGLETCLDCGDEIPDERRKAVPSARRCVDCQEAMEKRG